MNSFFEVSWPEQKAVLSSWEDTYLSERLRAKPDWPPRGEAAARTYKAVSDACELYLTGSDPQRDAIRAFFAGAYTLPPLLLDLAAKADKRLQETRDPHWLDLALAAVSLENLTVDYRDTYQTLGSLYLTALKAGLDPPTAIKRAAEISSGEGPEGALSTREFLERFEDSAFFAESVAARAGRLRSRLAGSQN